MPASTTRRRETAPPRGANVLAADASVLRLLERSAADPNVPIERLDRLVMLYDRLVQREAETRFNADLARMQPKLPVLEERGQITGPGGKLLASYATWEDIVEVIRPILARHGPGQSPAPGRHGHTPA